MKWGIYSHKVEYIVESGFRTKKAAQTRCDVYRDTDERYLGGLHHYEVRKIENARRRERNENQERKQGRGRSVRA